jgi:hypothetical protein
MIKTMRTAGVVSLAGAFGLSPLWALGAPKPAKDAVTIAVSPAGNDLGPGTREKPFRTLRRAQRAVREVNGDHDVTVELAEGIYRLAEPLVFTALDGGRNRHHVSWTGAEGAKPVLSGASAVSSWKLFDREKQIWVADVPVGEDARELWIDDELASPASAEIPRSDVEFTREESSSRMRSPTI